MRERGESPHCTAAVSVETGIAAKAGHWETEKVETGRRSMAPQTQVRRPFMEAQSKRLEEEPYWTMLHAEIRLRREIAAAFLF